MVEDNVLNPGRKPVHVGPIIYLYIHKQRIVTPISRTATDPVGVGGKEFPGRHKAHVVEGRIFGKVLINSSDFEAGLVIRVTTLYIGSLSPNNAFATDAESSTELGPARPPRVPFSMWIDNISGPSVLIKFPVDRMFLSPTVRTWRSVKSVITIRFRSRP